MPRSVRLRGPTHQISARKKRVGPLRSEPVTKSPLAGVRGAKCPFGGGLVGECFFLYVVPLLLPSFRLFGCRRDPFHSFISAGPRQNTSGYRRARTTTSRIALCAARVS